MKAKFFKQTQREYSPGKRVLLLAVAGLFFLVLLPGALLVISPKMDALLVFHPLAWGWINAFLGSILVITGILFAWWSIYVQFTRGRGTPVPIMATQKLIIQKPYNYCRNPMALGTIVAYLGEAVLIRSGSAVVLVLAGAALLLGYIKLLEEKEMEIRFGEAYRNYRKTTPFIIPRFW
jgi:protein-S-isoprenylcysteine O-methyltransferase Ste14